jgi:hypothetical protein
MLVHPRMSAFEAKTTIIGYLCHVAEGPEPEFLKGLDCSPLLLRACRIPDSAS